jgi:hypothetical protein
MLKVRDGQLLLQESICHPCLTNANPASPRRPGFFMISHGV